MLTSVMPNSIIVIKKKSLYVLNGLNVLYFDLHTTTINEMLDQ
jgi:prepilin-type processing-associated H-X9-DG protein